MAERTMLVQTRYLNLPVKNAAPVRVVRLIVGGDTVRQFDIELAEGEPDFWVYTDLAPFQGAWLKVAVEDVDTGALEALALSDEPVGLDDLYREKYRPQCHFSSRRGWINDPNGLVFYGGVYHLFYQHNPYGWKWGNMHWGHAESRDLVHWQETGDVLYPDHLGTMFSGSAVVDWQNTTGFREGADPPLVCIFTAAGKPFTQGLVYSADGGQTWRKYAGNPVMDHIAGENRDPKVIWHAPSRQWVMALYLVDYDYALFGSPDLKTWRRLCDVRIGDATECPDFFELPVDGDPENTRWLFWGANGRYVLGSFDGETFAPEGEVQCYDWGGNSYAAQTWSDIPAEDGRRIQIGWLRGNLPGMPFNQSMAFPCELTLRTTPEGVRLFSWPVREIETLYRRSHRWQAVAITPGDHWLDGIEGDLFDIHAALDLGAAASIDVVIRGISVRYDVAHGALFCEGRTVPLPAVDGTISLRILVDRASIEIFGNDGLVALPLGVIPPDDDHTLGLSVEGGPATVRSLVVHELEPVWRN